MKLNLRRRRQEKAAADRERDRRQDNELRAEIEAELSQFSGNPSASDVERLLVAFRREYLTRARRNAARLDKINVGLSKLIRVVMAIGVLFVVTQALLGLNALNLLHGQTQTTREVRHNQQSTVAALCTFRHDLELRAIASQNFLVTHPNGIPGISAATIEASVTMEKRTIRSLQLLPCSTQPKKKPKRSKHT